MLVYRSSQWSEWSKDFTPSPLQILAVLWSGERRDGIDGVCQFPRIGRAEKESVRVFRETLALVAVGAKLDRF